MKLPDIVDYDDIIDIDEGFFVLLLALMVIGIIAVLMFLFCFVTRDITGDFTKVSAYECGFEAFDDPHMRFEVQFYLIAISFLIFDIELVLIFPWALALPVGGLFVFMNMVIFLTVLTIAFMFELKTGALSWE